MEDEQAKGMKKSSLCNATVEVPVRHPRRGAERLGGGSSLEVRERMTLCLPEPRRPCLSIGKAFHLVPSALGKAFQDQGEPDP